MAHDHAASEARRQQDEWTHALSEVKKYRQELVVAEGALRMIASTENTTNKAKEMAEDAIDTFARLRRGR